jgi:HEAT repeat protein
MRDGSADVDEASRQPGALMRVRLLVVTVALLVPLHAGAQKPAPKKDPKKEAPPPAVDVKPAIAKIRSGEEAQVRAGLDDVRLAGASGAPAAPAIAEALTRGLSFALTQAAIDTLGDIEAEAGTGALVQYATHRNPKIRRAALKTLTRTKGAAAAAAFKRGLADPDAVVRATAASGLGAIKAKDAVPELFLALDHRVNEAAASIGQLCGPEQCADLVSRTGKLPFDVATSGLEPILFRPPTDVSDDTKVKVIGRIRELGTGEANKFLKDVQKRWPAAWSGRVRQSLDQAVLATSGGSK